jgi:hypothetical protein
MTQTDQDPTVPACDNCFEFREKEKIFKEKQKTLEKKIEKLELQNITLLTEKD